MANSKLIKKTERIDKSLKQNTHQLRIDPLPPAEVEAPRGVAQNDVHVGLLTGRVVQNQREIAPLTLEADLRLHPEHVVDRAARRGYDVHA
jgi:hypothetical protein